MLLGGNRGVFIVSYIVIVFQTEQAGPAMSDNVVSKGEILGLIVRLAALTTVSYLSMKLLMEAVDPTRKQRLAAQKKAERLLARLVVVVVVMVFIMITISPLQAGYKA